jgi:hypothetical protein
MGRVTTRARTKVSQGDTTETERGAGRWRTVHAAMRYADVNLGQVPFRQIRLTVCSIARDLGGDPSTAQRKLITRAATLDALCEDCEVQLLQGLAAPSPTTFKMTNTMHRLLTSLGLHRVPKDITSPLEYARAHVPADAEETVDG